ncbi:MAG: YbhB/YbcL family Raf kinase inhibitor-like protein [Streptosporangiaceae bacterium]|jgi:Raf kinase inhibitor-like YbhB/YbcL family protein|nr:hypothetical protein [Actinomycetota bacterium]
MSGRAGAISRWASAAATGLALSLLSGCGLIGSAQELQQDAPQVMTVTSPAFGPGGIPALYTCHGAGQSPPLYWSGAPQGTKSLALLVDDAAAPITPRVYWLVFDISPDTTDVQAGVPPAGARQARNSAGAPGYNPLCPVGGVHFYRFTVYALNSVIQLPPGAPGLKTAWSAIARHVIARGRLTAPARPYRSGPDRADVKGQR